MTSMTVPGTGYLATILARARSTGRRDLPDDVGQLADVADAVAVQYQVLEQLDADPPKGWKLGSTRDGQPSSAPLYPVVLASGPTEFPWRQGLLLEVELGMVLGKSLPLIAGHSYQDSEIMEAAAGVYLGLEICGSRLQNGSIAPYALFLADGLANDGYVLGPEVDNQLFMTAALPELHVDIDGIRVFSGQGKHPQNVPMIPLTAYVNGHAPYMRDLQRGQIITTGSLCGVIPIPTACTTRVSFEDKVIELRFVATA
ncbi:hypothetical protein [Bosea sp. PAMC 26642]|uniref:hypothetical protein n=1 Tax=Bosea sp. (strain PAMC 26642) TaxID=1792307 RepID=UPI00076FEF46|nr:hypothetical protein [Bosea sp. PAMC 26642]AMJ61537.1 hypothetical protein AXW83_15595 [Bosea sp. PAMC 26642]